MSIFHRYFRVTSGALVDRLHELKAATEAALEKYTSLRDEVGAEQIHAWPDGSFAGFTFKHPDRSTYRESRGAWLPKKNCAEGKALWARINELPEAPGPQLALRDFGLYGDVPCLLGDGYGWRTTLCGFYDSNIWFVKVPWKDADQDELKEYMAERKKTRFCADFEHLLWTPPADWKEIKEWEFLKEWEELNQK
ncbi:hypothetical protein [Pseudomonas aeruginosa]|uniref:hypothetical protein n=1 Tax=Pseudomonas aeruginosa TaxID=287 RepID=UPI0011B23767|nr:hypothetical protein [Pseudomonas aeruginosa]MDI2205072.1 hypothetical protein [Pseudomonas aeruginosa]MEC6341465.1 hypothetical protein [Pseudomonas aeruginosa]HBO1316281.1 hypothetical protein [Pseudomonas aeruginosa]HCL3488873.1 hypothetical protein [Pseudomonas aeruginosa]